MLGAVTTHPKPQALAYSESRTGRTALLGTPLQSSESRVWAPSIIRIPHFLGSQGISFSTVRKDYAEDFMTRPDGSRSNTYPHSMGQNSVLWPLLDTRWAGRIFQQCAQEGERNEIGKY